MDDILRAMALGVIQGLTEFLPISSSGHLIVARELFGWEFTDDLTFDVSLHLGTTVAVIAYFWSEWLAMLRGGWHWLFKRDRETGSPIVVGVMLIVFAIVLYLAERLHHGKRDVTSTDAADAVWIGVAQAVSLVPGVSRSGVTISAALTRGYSRSEAARLSFLLATPAILGAGLLKGAEAAVNGIPSGDIGAIVAGATVSAVVGWLSIRYLLRLLQTGTFTQFVAYRLIAGAFIVVYFSV